MALLIDEVKTIALLTDEVKTIAQTRARLWPCS